MAELRRVSTRARITRTSFTNHYDFGEFKGDPGRWMERYFDAFLYSANWSSHIVTLRVPLEVFDLRTARRYCDSSSCSVRKTRAHAIVEFAVSDEWNDEPDDDGRGWLSAIVPAREDLAAGDLRLLYLGWLLAVQAGDIDDDALEPPVPAGLQSLSTSLGAFAEFMGIDPALLDAAARASPTDTTTRDLSRWLARLPEGAKTRWLLRIAQRREPHAVAELLREFRRSAGVDRSEAGRRTAGALRAAAARRAARRQRR
jgi:hypothetical protein